MHTTSDLPFEAHFIDGAQGRLFGLYFPTVTEPKGQLLCLPPFTEESNRSRAMLTMAARALSQQGYATLLLDPFGTGDSAGDFEDATWDIWQQDVQQGVNWLQQRGDCVSLWGLRSGALLAATCLEQLPQVKRLLLWQPVTSGKQMLTQYLRLRVGNLSTSSSKPTTTKQLREQLAAGETLEIGGYYMSPALAQGLDQAVMPATLPHPETCVEWLEVVDPGKTEVSIGSLKVVGSWRSAGANVTTRPFTGPAFWQLHDRFLAPDLISKTVEAMADE